MVIKAIKRYQYSIVQPDALFVMVTDAEQVQNILINRILQQNRAVGQICLNDDVAITDEGELDTLRQTMHTLFQGLYPEPSPYEKVEYD